MNLVNALYDCDYKAYLNAMVEVQPILVADRFLQPHAGYIMRELHVLGYKQFLDSYKSVTLESMAESFGVSVDYLDLQLSRFIAAGRLTAKIDKYNGVVETNRPDLKNTQYRDMIQKGRSFVESYSKTISSCRLVNTFAARKSETEFVDRRLATLVWVIG